MSAMPLPQPSSVRDRTSEFSLLVERYQRALGPSPSQKDGSAAANGSAAGRGGGPGGLGLGPGTGLEIKNHSEFARKAADIGHGIHKTSLKLQKLTQLAKRTSMFDDPAQEVDELTGLIKADIQSLNAALNELQRVSARGKGGGQQEDSKQSLAHSSTVVDSLRTRLKDATEQFKGVLTVRTENLKHHKERRQLFSSTDDAESAPLLHHHPARHHHHHHQQGAAAAAAAGSSSLHSTTLLPPGGDGASSSSAPPPPVPSFLQAAQQQLTVAAPQESYLSTRAEALHNVEATIVELGTIFNKLADMVQQQGELAIRIDENVDETLGNVTSAQAQLLKYLNSISSNRWLIMKVFLVLLIFMVLFIAFIA